MSDGPPTEDKAVSTFLDYVALACIFGFVDALIAGKWPISLGALAAAIIFHIVGIKWPEIKLKVGTRFAADVVRVANDSRYRRGMVVLLVTFGLFFGVVWFRRIHRSGETKTAKESHPSGSVPPVTIESPAQPESTLVVPSSKPPQHLAERPATTETKVQSVKPTTAPPPTVTPPATTTHEQAQAEGAPPHIIPEDPVQAVQTVDRMRQSLTGILGKKDTITFLMSWPDDDVTNLAFISSLLSGACRITPRQCWFTQQGTPGDLDRPPVKGSGRRGITIHGPDAHALATALGSWFTTYSTESFPSELNGYRDLATQEIIWVEIGPGSPWKPSPQTDAPKPQASESAPPATFLDRVVRENRGLTPDDRNRLSTELYECDQFIKQSQAVGYELNSELGKLTNDRQSGALAKNVDDHIKLLRDLDTPAWNQYHGLQHFQEKWQYFPDQTEYVFGENPFNAGEGLLLNAVEGMANSLISWSKISNRDQREILNIEAQQQADFEKDLRQFFDWVNLTLQRIKQMRQSLDPNGVVQPIPQSTPAPAPAMFSLNSPEGGGTPFHTTQSNPVEFREPPRRFHAERRNEGL